MRTFLDNARKRRPRDRHRSRFARRNASAGGSALIRYRRNQELLFKESCTAGLWFLLVIMLIHLAGTLGDFSRKHLADHVLVIRMAFPALSVIAAAACLWRGSRGIREILDIRREQKDLHLQLRELSRGGDS